ncbi:hypothetical protein SESBI_39259 [Sesbania bispinosa]|nr:hypothetical protein SESBI_39259 [Sesbania bispinosa]
MARKRVRATLRLLDTTCRNYAKKGVPRELQKATKDLQVKGKFINPGKQIIGSVSGVEVGDEFLYWREFNVVGLHRQITCGIDYVNVNGMLLATSIVSGWVYDNDVEDTNELVYMEEGGNVIKRERKPKDQKLNGVDKYWHEKWLHERNMGKIPFNGKKATVVGRPNCIGYECCPSCKCPPTCQNKVSQHGIQFQFKIFKTKTKG